MWTCGPSYSLGPPGALVHDAGKDGDLALRGIDDEFPEGRTRRAALCPRCTWNSLRACWPLRTCPDVDGGGDLWCLRPNAERGGGEVPGNGGERDGADGEQVGDEPRHGAPP